MSPTFFLAMTYRHVPPLFFFSNHLHTFFFFFLAITYRHVPPLLFFLAMTYRHVPPVLQGVRHVSEGVQDGRIVASACSLRPFPGQLGSPQSELVQHIQLHLQELQSVPWLGQGLVPSVAKKRFFFIQVFF